MLLAALVTVLSGEAGAADLAPTARVEYRNDLLSVDLQRTPLADVIDELGRQSGAAIHGHVRKPRELSLLFADVPLPDALERVLGEQNFTLRYGAGGRLEAIDLLGEPRPLLAPAATAGEPGSPTSLQVRGPGGAAPAAAGQGARAGLSVSVLGGPAANGQGGAPGPPGAIAAGLQTAAQAQTSTRDHQQQEGDPTAADLEQRIRRSVMNSLDAMDDASLAAFMDTPEGKRVQALLQFYADHHVGSHRQQQASGIIQRLPSAPAPAPAPAPSSGSPTIHTWR